MNKERLGSKAMKKEIRLLEADEIECGVATINEKGVSLLLFKDARVDQKILDETFTPFGWSRSHQNIEGNLYCTVEIWDEDKLQWVGKQDVGTMSYSEKEKGQASDSFKRVCFNWGIGRELYTAPFIWIPASKVAIQKKGDKYVTTERFNVKEISYNAKREIVSLIITNSQNTVLFSLGANQNSGLKEKLVKGINIWQMQELERELERTGVEITAVLDRYGLQSLSQMTEEIFEMAMKGLQKTKAREAA